MRSSIYLKITILLIFLGSCKEVIKKEASVLEVDPFTEIKSPAQTSSSLPFLFSNGNKTLLSWVEKEGDSLSILKYSELMNGEWQDAQEILRGTDWFVNWADFPMIAENRGNLWSHVLKKSTAGTYSYDVKMNLLSKGDSIWKTDVALHTDGTPTEHGFVTVLPYKEDFFVTWLDGRNTEENEAEERGAMSIRAAQVNSSGTVSEEHELDISTCDCCQTTAAITENGPVVIYRDRSETEVRDISIVRQVDGKWTTPKPVHIDNWKIKGCPVNGPKAVALDNTLAVAWFTGAQQKPRVQLAFSNDGGAEFAAPIKIAAGNVLGRVDVLLLDKNTAIVSWVESKDKKTKLKAVKVSSTGEQSAPVTIAKMNGSRKSGFPQMELVNDRIHFAWTDFTNGNTIVKTGYVTLTQF